MHTLTQVAERPSGWDSRSNYAGTPLDEFSNLYVVLTRNRDSDLLSESNWNAALKQLGGESEHVQIVRFGHWACGWWEALCVTQEKQAEGQAIADAIEDYPILDESDFSERECDAANDMWVSLSIKERVQMCQEHRVCIFAARHGYVPSDDNGSLQDSLLRGTL